MILLDKNKGLYIIVGTDGTINKKLVTGKGAIDLPATNIEDEIIYFTEISYKEYVERISEIEELSFAIENDDADNFGQVDMKLFYKLLQMVNEIIWDMEEMNLLLGTLTRTLIEDNKIDDDGSAMYVFNTIYMLCNCFKEVLNFNLIFKIVIENLCEKSDNPIPKEYSHIRQGEFKQIFSSSNNNKLQYHFRSIKSYMHFLLLYFLNSDPNIAWCNCCGRYFIPKTRKQTLYCDRIIEDGKTCKEIGPKLKRKFEAKKDIVIDTYNKTYQKLYKRYERSSLQPHESPKSLSISEFYNWQDKATNARNDYMKGNMTAEEALKIIVVND